MEFVINLRCPNCSSLEMDRIGGLEHNLSVEDNKECNTYHCNDCNRMVIVEFLNRSNKPTIKLDPVEIDWEKWLTCEPNLYKLDMFYFSTLDKEKYKNLPLDRKLEVFKKIYK